jgi:hypothetical protein
MLINQASRVQIFTQSKKIFFLIWIWQRNFYTEISVIPFFCQKILYENFYSATLTGGYWLGSNKRTLRVQIFNLKRQRFHYTIEVLNWIKYRSIWRQSKCNQLCLAQTNFKGKILNRWDKALFRTIHSCHSQKNVEKILEVKPKIDGRPEGTISKIS